MKTLTRFLFTVTILLFVSFPSHSYATGIKTKILTAEFIYETAPFPSCHASTIVETKEGLLAAWFGGTDESNPDVCIYSSSCIRGKWSVPVMVADGIESETLRYACWNPVLFKKGNGDIILYYKVGLNPREWWGMYKISTDNGNTWSVAIKIPDHLLGPIKNKPCELKNGTILYPTSIETKQGWNVYMEQSDQNLSHWEKTAIDNNGLNAIQPTILFHKEEKIQILCRSKEKKIAESWSANQGKSWTSLQLTNLPNNNSGIDAVTLKNGMHLLICNPIENGRNKLALFSSEDGKIWDDLLILEDQPKGEFSYPAIIETEDGTVHITYTWNREKIKYVHLQLR